MKEINRKILMSKLVISLILISSVFTSVLLILDSPIPILAQSDAIIQNNLSKNSIPHNAEGHESHQVVQFIQPKHNTLYQGVVTFKSSIPIDVIVYNDTSNIAENTINLGVKTWKIGEKTFVPTTIMKNATSGTIDFRGSGITAHIPYNQSYNVEYSLQATSSNIK
jgi:hypothetical protein